MMTENRLRQLLNEGKPSLSTRIWSTWPFYTECVGATGNYDYMEFVAEYAPFDQCDLENIARAAMDNIEEICVVPGVDMVQFGPSDYCMSRGWDRTGHTEEFKAAERRMIEVALRHGVQPRCEINTPEEAQYYIDLGVRHFSLGDQLAKLKELWAHEGAKMRQIADGLL